VTDRIVVVGDTLLDRDVEGVVNRLCPDAPVPVLDEAGAVERPGGAGLAAVLAARQGLHVALVTALADDAGGARLSELLTAAGVEVYPLALSGATCEKIRLRSGGRVLLRLDRGGGGHPGEPTDETLALLMDATAIVVSDYGRGVARQPALRAALERSAAPVVWDPHPRGPAAVPGIRLATPNEAEVRELAGAQGSRARLLAATRGAQAMRQRWRAGAVAVTMGRDGALLCHAGATPLVVPAPIKGDGDTCGAGDQFAVAATVALARGALVSEAVEEAVARASTYVSDGGVATVLPNPPAHLAAGDLHPVGPPAPFPWAAEPSAPAPAGPAAAGGVAVGGVAASGVAAGSVAAGSVAAGAAARRPAVRSATAAAERIGPDPAGALVARVRAAGGVVVATGGCFDLLHAGHVATLQAAREQGDCLIVCLNSDASVAGLKGPDRPLVPQADRARLLAALGCVDAVMIFDEPMPHAVLSWLRPDIWVKGGDYGTGGGDEPNLPEADLVQRWGGQTVVVPYLDGRSTTSMIAAARSGRPPNRARGAS
jgi:rfaE bifunctional protein nucleotidyltransferase chain/domain/rfaE bifunctional protein kinase chain/domain